jgi:hypothetical protein
VKDRVKPLATIRHQHYAVSGSHVQRVV